jgi:anti-sigma factor RsiW
MRCGEIHGLFTRRLDGRLDAAGLDALEAHLRACPACRAELAGWEASSRLLRAAGPTLVPAGLAERAFRAAIAAQPTPPLSSWFVAAGRRAAVAGAIAAVVIWVGVLFERTSRPRPEASAQDPIEVAVLLWAGEVGGDAE